MREVVYEEEGIFEAPRALEKILECGGYQINKARRINELEAVN